MSINNTIQEGGVAKQITSDKLKTNLVGGGTETWVPESKLGTKSITEDGTYYASDDGLVGFSSVTVNVSSSSGGSGSGSGGSGSGGSGSGSGSGTGTTGTGQDGNEYNYNTDDQGNIVQTKLPSSIAVVTPPTNQYGIYTNGQAIEKTGMVVKAYYADGTEYGTVDNDEITLSPTTATYDAETDTGGSRTAASDAFGDDISIMMVTEVEAKQNPFTGDRVIYTYTMENGAMFQNDNSSINIIAASDSSNATYTISFQRWFSNAADTDPPSASYTYSVVLDNSYTYNGKTVYYKTIGIGSTYQVSGGAVNNIPGYNAYSNKLAWMMIYGDIETVQAGSHQTITVSWTRPADGEVLTTTFEVLVAPGYTQGDNNEL